MSQDYIDDRLHAWARWALRERGPQGFGKETTLYRMIRDGVPIRVEGQRPEAEATEEEETDRAVTYLRDRKREIWEVVVMHYLGRGTINQKARDLGIGRSLYFARLGGGKDCIDAYLSALA